MREDWEQQLKDHPDVEVDKRLLWEYDMKDFDWQKERHIVVERVINIGVNLNAGADVLALFKLYDGYEGVRKILKKEIFGLSKFGEDYVCKAFNLKRKELEGYRRKQERRKLFGKPVDKTDWWQT